MEKENYLKISQMFLKEQEFVIFLTQMIVVDKILIIS